MLAVFRNLKNSKSQDVNDFNIRPIKYVVDIVTPVLTYIFNLSLSSGVFPKAMQCAKVVTLYKGGDRNMLKKL